MKNILVTLPFEVDEKIQMQNAVSDSDESYQLIYLEDSSVDICDIQSASAIIGMIPPSLLGSADSLEWLQLAWAGVEPYLQPGVLQEKTVLTNASGTYGIAVAEHMMALTLALSCSLNKYIDQQKAHIWQLLGRKNVLYGSKVLVMGTGDIGSQYAMRMKAMGAYVIGISRTTKKKEKYFDEQYTVENMDIVLGRADIMAMALPGGKGTYHIIKESQLERMKKGAIIINVGRGSTIDTAALINALQKGTIGGAGLDVFEEEPLQDSRLWDMENVIITPHVAGKLEDEFNRKRVITLCIDNLYRYSHGKKLLHLVDQSVGY
mgnify:CR=1 FL=1